MKNNRLFFKDINRLKLSAENAIFHPKAK